MLSPEVEVTMKSGRCVKCAHTPVICIESVIDEDGHYGAKMVVHRVPLFRFFNVFGEDESEGFKGQRSPAMAAGRSPTPAR